jgi:hypothetical protein
MFGSKRNWRAPPFLNSGTINTVAAQVSSHQEFYGLKSEHQLLPAASPP